jgi:eukaryotic-like serine/threonine-protein kinase
LEIRPSLSTLVMMESHLGRYTVLAHLASGGMADVLLARTDGIEGFQRHVVLKRIRPEYARDERFIRMFLHEARLVADLHHHNIVQVYDVGQDGDEYFLAMEYLHGEDLRTVLAAASKRRAHVPLGHVIAIVSAAAAGLHYAHERRGSDNRALGIVHRDISPSNLLVGYDGSIKVVDFGIAKASAKDDTHSGSLRGKISYLSPEQCKGERVDRRSDVYALGVVLYELATTTRLFKGDSDYKVMDAIVNGRIAPPKVRRPDLPDELAAIITRALAVDPERRYLTADELRVALDQVGRKTGLTSSPSAIAVYMRKQFGERAEPWIDAGAAPVRPSGGESSLGSGIGAGASWVELPLGDASRSSTSSIPVQTGPFGIEGLAEAAASIAPAREPSVPPPAPSAASSAARLVARRPTQPRPGRSLGKAAMIGVPLVLLAGVAVWRLVLGDHDAAPVVAVAAPVVRAAPVAPPPPPAAEPPAVHMPAIADLAPAAAAPVVRTRHELAAAEPSRASASVKKTVAAKTIEKPEAPAEPPPAAPAPPVALPAVHVAAAPPPPAPEPAPAPAAIAPPVVAAPAAPAAMPNVASVAFDANRIAGDKNIVPDDSTKSEMRRRGSDKVIGAFKLCLTASGEIGTVSLIKSTGFTDYDGKIQTTIRTKWRYKPFLVNGQASPVCTAVRFVYSQN